MIVLLVHAFCCWFMTGVIWLVQILVYPLFQHVGEAEFQSAHQFHMKKITWVVVPAMTLELVTGAWLLYNDQNQIFFWNFISVVSLWLITAWINVPTHNKLSFQSKVSQINLVRFNFPRTFLWSFRSVFLIYVIHHYGVSQ